jgi:hypothetical protein
MSDELKTTERDREKITKAVNALLTYQGPDAAATIERLVEIVSDARREESTRER